MNERSGDLRQRVRAFTTVNDVGVHCRLARALTRANLSVARPSSGRSPTNAAAHPAKRLSGRLRPGFPPESSRMGPTNRALGPPQAFISHAEADAWLAQALVELLRLGADSPEAASSARRCRDQGACAVVTS